MNPIVSSLDRSNDDSRQVMGDGKGGVLFNCDDGVEFLSLS